MKDACAVLNVVFGVFLLVSNKVCAVEVSKRTIIACPTADARDFEALAKLGKELGATHLDVSDLPKDRWQWVDPNDPYPNWSLMVAGILKVMAPPELRPAVPAAIAEKSQRILKERGDILRKYGLAAAFHGAEPMWLPDAVYARHPDWRGPRCQSPIRARHDYYAPNVDNAEVLALYRKAAAGLCRLAPIDDFSFLVNDSGAGMCWHPGLYPGANGPVVTKDRPMQERLDGFINTLKAGAEDAGLDARVVLAGSGLDPVGDVGESLGAGSNNYFWASKCYPVPGISDPVAYVAGVARAFAHPEAKWRFGVPSLDCTECFDLIREYRKGVPAGLLGEAQALNAVAGHIAGPAGAPALTQAWRDIHEAIVLIAQIDNGGPVLLLGSVNQRWLVRPLVPFPLELKPEEKGYYRPFQFQAQTDEAAANLMNCQGLFLISGDAGTALAHAIFGAAETRLQSADQGLGTIATRSAAVETLQLRVRALELIIRNADITARYQAFLDRFRPEWMARPDRAGYPVPENGERIVQEDMDNAKALIALLRSTKARIIDTAPTSADEDVFWMNPDLTGQMEKKIEVELRHLPEHQRLLHP